MRLPSPFEPVHPPSTRRLSQPPRLFGPPLLLAALLACSMQGTAQDAQSLRELEQLGEERNEERREAQQEIDALNEDTRKVIDEYRAELKIVAGLETYIRMLEQQLAGQQSEISTLQTSITDVAVIERQILPLMSRMIDGLEQFIALDVPFLAGEREERVTKLRELITRSDVTVAEKSRRVFEAYQVETDYGRTIEAYRAKLLVDGGSFDSDFLRVGRVSLMYRTVGDERLGYWDSAAGSWQALPNTPYRRLIEQGLKVARQEIAPELLTIPVNTASVSGGRP